MNEEEKQAIEYIKEELEGEKKRHNHIYKEILGLYDNGSIETILNLIDKQQKEIEDYQILKDDIEGHRIVYVDTPEFEEKYISKDEIRHIRDKAECMDYYSLNDVIDDLSKLIGDENNGNE